MTVENAVPIATVGDWPKISRQFLNQAEAKPKPIAPCTRVFPVL